MGHWAHSCTGCPGEALRVSLDAALSVAVAISQRGLEELRDAATVLAGTFPGAGGGSWGTLRGPSTCSTRHGGVAQVAEQGSHKPRVGGSSPPAATTLSPSRGPVSLNRRFAAGTLRLP